MRGEVVPCSIALEPEDRLGVVEGAEVRFVLEDYVDVRRDLGLHEEGVHAVAGFLRRVLGRRELVSGLEGNLVLLAQEAEGVAEVCGVERARGNFVRPCHPNGIITLMMSVIIAVVRINHMKSLVGK